MARQIGKQLRKARKAKGLTQEQMGTHLGIGRAGYANIENGRSLITVDHLIKLPDILQQPVDFFLGRQAELSQDEAELIQLYRSLPEGLPREWLMFLAREWVKKMENDWEDFIRRHAKG